MDQGIQIVLLTCHPSDYTALLGAGEGQEQATRKKNPLERVEGMAGVANRVMVSLD
jgi:hypothetical protein